MYCNNLKIRTKKGLRYIYCIKLKKTITYYECKICPYKEYKLYKALAKATKKQNKTNSKRISVFVKGKEKQCICGSNCGLIDKHEIFGGKNRINSIKYGFVIYL